MNISTLTMNPALDKNTAAKLIVAEKKIRCNFPEFAPGGGGINVSRAIRKLGGDSHAFYLAGGNNGDKMEKLLNKENIEQTRIKADNETRENLIVYDKTTKNLYRFGMPGHKVKEKYWKEVLTHLNRLDPKPDYLVASGSLPPGVPDDFYAQVASWARAQKIKLILDTSGTPLKLALEEGVYMIKPNLRELANLYEKKMLTGIEQEEIAKDLIVNQKCEMVVLSLGAKGAMLARQDDIVEYVNPPTMPVLSAVGAGDSMVAGILVGLSQGMWPVKAVQYGVSAGTAAAMTPGSDLCRKDDTDKIYSWFNPK